MLQRWMKIPLTVFLILLSNLLCTSCHIIVLFFQPFDKYKFQYCLWVCQPFSYGAWARWSSIMAVRSLVCPQDRKLNLSTFVNEWMSKKYGWKWPSCHFQYFTIWSLVISKSIDLNFDRSKSKKGHKNKHCVI